MSFTLGWYKDIALDKLSAVKEKAAAALKQLDNCDVKLKIITNNSTKDKMPLVRSKSKCKTKCSHSTERVYKNKPRYYYESSDDSDSESDCSCDDCHHPARRGRSPHITVEGGQKGQQNIQIHCNCAKGRCKHRRGRSRSRSSSIVIIPGQEYLNDCSPILLPRHADGTCCIHGRGWLVDCSRCPVGHRIWGPARRMNMMQPYYSAITDDDGTVNFIDNEMFQKHVHGLTKSIEEKEREKKKQEKLDLETTMSRFKKMYSEDGFCGGHAYGWGPRSADILSQIAKLKADKEQLHARALLNGRLKAQQSHEELAMCSGALKEEGKVEKKPVKGILKITKPQFVVDGTEGIQPRIQEVKDEDSGHCRGSCCSVVCH